MNNSLDIAILQSPGMLDGSDDRLAWLEAQLQDHDIASSDLLILPELFQCGYFTNLAMADVAEPANGLFAQQIQRLAITYKLAIVYGYAEKTDNALYNSAQCIDSKGQRIGHHRKLLLPPGFEKSVFSAGTTRDVFRLGTLNVSMLICYDFEFPENARHVAAAGAQLIIVPTALARQWGVVSEKLAYSRAFENGVFIAYANHCGHEYDKEYFGGSCIVAPSGIELARADNESRVLTARVSPSYVEEAQKNMPYLKEYLKLPSN